jgi:DNA modification methylase
MNCRNCGGTLDDRHVRPKYKILCGDSTSVEDVGRLMDGERAKWWWSDPPWNVAYGSSDHPTYRSRTIQNDNLGDEFPGFCRAFIAQAKSVLHPGAMVYLVMSAQEWPVIDAALREGGFHWSSTLIWKKDRLVLSRKDYHTQFEPLWYGWEDSAPRLCPLEDRTQSDVWEIDRPSRSEEHPTMKPVELVARSLQNSSRPNDLGYEPFSGSGSTFVAAEQTGRRCYGMEIEPKYVGVTLQRLADMGLIPGLQR